MGKMQLDLLLLLPYNALHAMAVLWLILLATFNLFGVFHLFFVVYLQFLEIPSIVKLICFCFCFSQHAPLAADRF